MSRPLVLLLLGLTVVTASEADDFPIRLASLWAGPGEGAVTGCDVGPDGVVHLAGHEQAPPPPGVRSNALGSWQGGAWLLRIHGRTRQVLSHTSLPGSRVQGLRVDEQNGIRVLSDGVLYNLDRTARRILWQTSVDGHRLNLAPGGHCVVTSKGRATLVDPQGAVVVAIDAGGGQTETATVDEERRLVFVGGWSAASNIWWPWIRVFDFGGTQQYTLWDTRKGGTADTIVRSLYARGGKLFVGGRSDGNPTHFETDPQDASVRLPRDVTGPNPWGSADPASSREVGCLTVIDIESRQIEVSRRIWAPATVPRGDRMKTLAGTTYVTDVRADDAGRIYVTGYAMGRMKTTAGSPHSEVGPPTIVGRWNNPEVPDEPFLCILPPAADRFLFSGRFGQGGTDRYRGHFLQVGARDGIVVAGGWAEKPVPALPGTSDSYEPAGELIHLQDPLMAAWGSDEGPGGYDDLSDKQKKWGDRVRRSDIHKQRRDGYFAILGGEPVTDIAEMLRIDLAELDTGAIADELSGLLVATCYEEPVATLQQAAAAGGDAGRVAQLRGVVDAVLRRGESLLAQAAAKELPDPAAALAEYRQLAARWGGLEPGRKASERLAALRADEAFQDRLEAEELYAAIAEAESGLQAGEGGAGDCLSVTWFGANKRALLLIQRTADELREDHPATPATERALALCRRLHLPLGRDEEQAYEYYVALVKASGSLKTPRGSDATVADAAFARANARELRTMAAALKRLAEAHPEHAYTARANEIAGRYGIELP